MSKLALFHKVHLIKKSTRSLCLLPTGLNTPGYPWHSTSWNIQADTVWRQIFEGRNFRWITFCKVSRKQFSRITSIR